MNIKLTPNQMAVFKEFERLQKLGKSLIIDFYGFRRSLNRRIVEQMDRNKLNKCPRAQ